MSVFSVEFTPAAARDLQRLDPAVRLQLLRASTVRLRVGDYRMIYRMEESQVLVVRVAHRREAYL